MKTEQTQPFRFNAFEENDCQTIIQVSEDDYQKDLASGVPEDELLKPGKHIFRRRKRIATKEELHPSNTKVEVMLKLDLDVLNYFKERANELNAASYQAQINDELRAIMERDQKSKTEE